MGAGDNGQHPATTAAGGEGVVAVDAAPPAHLNAQETAQFQAFMQEQSMLAATIANSDIQIETLNEQLEAAKAGQANAVKALRDSRTRANHFMNLVAARLGLEPPIVIGSDGTVMGRRTG